MGWAITISSFPALISSNIIVSCVVRRLRCGIERFTLEASYNIKFDYARGVVKFFIKIK